MKKQNVKMAKKQFKSVSEVVNNLSEDPKFANKVMVRINEKLQDEVVKLLQKVKNLENIEQSYETLLKNENKFSKSLAKMVETWLKIYYGPRCEDFEPGCKCCKVWVAFDEMFDMVLK